MKTLAPVLGEFFATAGAIGAPAGHRRSVARRTRALTS
jgi:hypothetical protein